MRDGADSRAHTVRNEESGLKQATIRWAVATLAMAALLTVRVCVAQETAAPVVMEFSHVVMVDMSKGESLVGSALLGEV